MLDAGILKVEYIIFLFYLRVHILLNCKCVHWT